MYRFMQLACCAAVLVGAMLAPAWSGDLPPVPSPKGFVESSSLVPALKDQALLGHPATTRLIGVYLLPDELANILHGGSEQLTIFCRAYLIDEFRSEDEARVFFRRMIANAKQEQSKKFDLADPDVSRIIRRYIEATKQRQGQSVNMIGATILGSILETDDTYATSVIVSMSADTDQGQVVIPVTGAAAWMRQRNQVLELSSVSRFDGTKSIDAANTVLLEWVKAVVRTNAGP